MEPVSRLWHQASRRLSSLPCRPSGMADRPRSSSHPLRGPSARLGRMPRESLDAPEDLSKKAPRQVALGQLEDKVPRMPDEAPAPRASFEEARGRRIVKRLPAPGALSTSTVPPWAVTMARTRASPSPVPPVSRPRAASSRTKGSKIRAAAPGSMEIPVSRTVMRAWPLAVTNKRARAFLEGDSARWQILIGPQLSSQRELLALFHYRPDPQCESRARHPSGRAVDGAYSRTAPPTPNCTPAPSRRNR
jgi:hypothetical protein